MKKILVIIFLSMLWFNTGLAEIKQNYNCTGVSIAGKTEWDLIIKKKSEYFYDVSHSAYPKENPFFAKFIEQGNMLMWFSSYKDENDNMLFIDMFEIHSSGNTHLVLSVSDFKSTAEFDQIHRMYEGIVEMKKNPNDADPARLLFSEVSYHNQAGKIAQRALKEKNFDTLYEMKCKAS